jgi:glycosyltransferase involved in cell wall biosynthesis
LSKPHNTETLSSRLVTICVPTFDRLPYLKEAVASALAQTHDCFEVLIGDDGRSEAIREWGEKFAAHDSRVRYQRNPFNRGLAGNWNALADAARGEFLVIIGDDDRLLPNFVAKLVEIIGLHANVAFANHYLIDNEGVRLDAESKECTRRYARDHLTAGEVADAVACVWRNSVPMSAALLRTADVKRLRFKEDLNTPEIELFARLAQEGGRFVFTPEYLSEYRVHARSATSAGLRSEKLVEYLSAIPVSAEVEPHKREFMAGLLVDAVGRCLRLNEREQARQFLRHEYYPRLPSLTYYVQEFCATLPGSLGSGAYHLVRRIKRA